ncbi:ABC transporter substrate-binding protein [Pseudothauera rhizosphaerae]|uniref:ABC transporter substrate-binding protein n=2 Tax=Pseudothauera rhizosphaerae TaxID=2565932 RepID=A0A4S4AU76_9RHOO|nr:ABC transporter substrate-binding protein [Pseudothauera rhizosphaerae]
MPVPLRRPFKSGLDRALARHAAHGGGMLDCRLASGGQWDRPFDDLVRQARTGALDEVPAMLVTTFHHDILLPDLLDHYRPAPRGPQPELHPACTAAGLPDPEGVFRVFAVVPFVFLIDERRLRGRAAPRRWEDLLDPAWRDEIVFGGWRPDGESAYQDYNAYLLTALHREFGDAGLTAFAANVRHLQHNVRTASRAGSNSAEVGAVAILPWMQAELCPRRDRTRVLWPEDGALAMPIAGLVRHGADERVRPLMDYLLDDELGAVLARNCYPPATPRLAGLPPGARFKWPGWDYVRGHDMAERSRAAAACFFDALYARTGLRTCA